MSKIKFITLDKFLETKNKRIDVKRSRRDSKLFFFPKRNEKPVWLIFKGEIVLDLKIFNLTPGKKNIFRIYNPATNEKMKIECRLTKDQKELFMYQIKTRSGINYVAYLTKWDLSHWSGFSSIQEEKAKEFSSIYKAKNWLGTISGIKTTQMAYSIVKFSRSGLDLQLPCKIGLMFSFN